MISSDGCICPPRSVKQNYRISKPRPEQLKDRCEIVVAIGIGGSYLGAKAVLEALSNTFIQMQTKQSAPLVLFAGQNIGEDYLYELQHILQNRQFGLINISKSGTTTEPALAFRLLKKQLEDQVGKNEAKNRIIAITDASKGALRKLADKEGYKTFIIPDNVGGRFSVLASGRAVTYRRSRILIFANW